MPAGQATESFMKCVHGDERIYVAGFGVGGHEVAIGAFFAIEGDTVTGKVEDDAVFRSYGLRDGLREPFQDRRPVGIEQGKMYRISVLFLQSPGHTQGIVDRCAQGRNVFIIIDAKDESVALLEGELGVVISLGHGYSRVIKQVIKLFNASCELLKFMA